MPRKVELNENGSKDYAVYIGKPVTTAVQNFYDWLKEETGYAKLDLTSVKLAKTLGADFQRFGRENGSPRARTTKGETAPKPVAKLKAAKAEAKPAAESSSAGVRAAKAARAAKPETTVQDAKRSAARRGAPKAEVPAAKPTAPRTGRRGKAADTVAAPY